MIEANWPIYKMQCFQLFLTLDTFFKKRASFLTDAWSNVFIGSITRLLCKSVAKTPVDFFWTRRESSSKCLWKIALKLLLMKNR